MGTEVAETESGARYNSKERVGAEVAFDRLVTARGARAEDCRERVQEACRPRFEQEQI